MGHSSFSMQRLEYKQEPFLVISPFNMDLIFPEKFSMKQVTLLESGLIIVTPEVPAGYAAISSGLLVPVS